MSKRKHKQAGSTLLISLMLLMIITLGGLSALSVSMINQKSTANYMDKTTAYQAAENQLFSLLAASGGEWFQYVPKTLTTTSVVDKYKNTGTSTSIPKTTLTMTLIEYAPVPVGELSPNSSVDEQYLRFDTYSAAKYGVSSAQHRMLISAQLPLSGSGEPGKDDLD